MTDLMSAVLMYIIKSRRHSTTINVKRPYRFKWMYHLQYESILMAMSECHFVGGFIKDSEYVIKN